MQRVTRYPLLLSRLVKVTPTSHGDRGALQESMELIEQGLDTMNQETARDSGTTKLWRRISMINPQGSRRSEHPIDLLGSTTWGVRKMVLETLHLAHQGVYRMLLRADKVVWWPGMSSDVRQVRKQCTMCDEVAPSQPQGIPVKAKDPVRGEAQGEQCHVP